MQINKISGNWLKTFEITKKRSFNGKNGKSNFYYYYFLPTLLHDLAASRQVKRKRQHLTNFRGGDKTQFLL